MGEWREDGIGFAGAGTAVPANRVKRYDKKSVAQRLQARRQVNL
jgi:hypothetical protein